MCSPLTAQTITGTVRDSLSGLAIPGAVVSAFDSAGHAGRRTISDAFGRFAVDVPAGPALLRLIRIGFEPRTVILPAAPEARRARWDIRMRGLPALLTQVRVSSQAICPGKEDRSGALALWEQARAGLLAAVVARRSKPGRMTVLDYVTDEAPDSRLVLKQATRTTEGTTKRPFVAVREANEFARHGYMARDGASLTFFAPDADVLLDREFASTHCFSIVRDTAGHPNEIGLTFAPSPGGRPDDFVDVSGTLWLESDPPALRTLDFAYTGLDRAYRDAGTGGSVVFRNMPNGLVFIDRWRMDLPAMVGNTPAGGRLPAREVGSPFVGGVRNTHVVQWREVGGAVLSAHWSDGAYAASTLGAVTGVARDVHGHPLPGVTVRLHGTESVVETDAEGRFTLSPVVPGHYAVDVVDSAYAGFIDPRRAERTLTVGRDTLDAGVPALPSRADAANRLCGDAPQAPANSTIVLGTVRTAAGPPGSGTHIEGSWTAVRPGNSSAWHSGTNVAKSGDDGRFIVCHVPPGAALALRIVRRDSVVADTTVTVGAGPVQQLQWNVGR